MATQKFTITIDSIWGGHSPSIWFANSDQYLSSRSIDPQRGFSDDGNDIQAAPAGILRPSPFRELDVGAVSRAPLWIKGSPRTEFLYVYSANGSVYTIDDNLSDIADLTDLNDGGNARGNGMAYYDNYMYFARATTVARYGPLDGTPAFTDDFWVGTLGKTALTDTTYPSNFALALDYPNHVLHRHSDGKLYIADVVGNTGALHTIQTSKTTVEGDTDANSTYDKVHVGYGLYPTAIESYGTDLVIGFWEGDATYDSDNIGDNRTNAKVGFWDTTSQNITNIIWVEYPDPFISAIRNVNGTLYFFSGSGSISNGYRIMQYVGGTSFIEVFRSIRGSAPHSGAVETEAGRLVWGTNMEDSQGGSGALLAKGIDGNIYGTGVYNIQGITHSTGVSAASAVCTYTNGDYGYPKNIVGWTNTATVAGIDIPEGYGNNLANWYSQVYKIGQPFKITKIRFPLGQDLTSLMDVDIDIFVDGGPWTAGATYDLENITSTADGTNTRMVVRRPQNLTGSNDFCMRLTWSGTALCAISLPITIEYELLDVDTTHP